MRDVNGIAVQCGTCKWWRPLLCTMAMHPVTVRVCEASASKAALSNMVTAHTESCAGWELDTTPAAR
jgi:hypothetical protein